MDPQDFADFNAAHAALAAHPDVKTLVDEFRAGKLTVIGFLSGLLTVPEVEQALTALGAGVTGSVGGPLALLEGPLMHLALKFLEVKSDAAQEVAKA